MEAVVNKGGRPRKSDSESIHDREKRQTRLICKLIAAVRAGRRLAVESRIVSRGCYRIPPATMKALCVSVDDAMDAMEG